jgi:hypothetical protein
MQQNSNISIHHPMKNVRTGMKKEDDNGGPMTSVVCLLSRALITVFKRIYVPDRRFEIRATTNRTS